MTRFNLSAVVAAGLLACTLSHAQANEKIRIGVPTKAYWPTMVVETGIRQKLFQKEGLDAQMTIFRGGAEAYEALPAGAADVILSSVWLIATGQSKGVMTQAVAGGQIHPDGWYLMVRSNSKAKSIKDLEGKKIGITSAGSGSDFLALWAMKQYNVKMTRVPLGGGGLVPNMLAGNVDAVVLYSPLSFQEMENKEAHAILDFAKELPAHMQGVWIANEKMIKEKPKMIQGAVNALFGAVAYMQEHRDYSIKLISEIDDVPASVATREYEVTINDLLKDGAMNDKWIDAALEYARAGGVRPDVPLKNLYTTQFAPVPTKPGS